MKSQKRVIQTFIKMESVYFRLKLKEIVKRKNFIVLIKVQGYLKNQMVNQQQCVQLKGIRKIMLQKLEYVVRTLLENQH